VSDIIRKRILILNGFFIRRKSSETEIRIILPKVACKDLPDEISNYAY